MSFNSLGLSQPVLQALELQGYTTPTPIQEQAIPLVLEGRDLLGIAQTGTGKTAAFMLPSIDNLRAADNRIPFKSCRMLVLAPTRELAGQIAKSAEDYGAMAGLKVECIVGGTSVGKDRNKLHRGTDILVATPGRLLDLVDQKALNLSGVEVLVLDEADQMLDLGFIHALRRIVQLVPEDRQTLFFSATMPKAIKELVTRYCNDPAQVSVTPSATTAEKVDQFVCFVNQSEKQALLTHSLRKGLKSGEIDRVLVFTRTKHGADRVVRKLAQDNVPASAIHGNKSQPQREKALGQFRQGKIRVLVATDVAARGIDIPGVSHVINYELPNVAEQYVHRIGRTARAGASGVALAFCAADERAYLKDIQKLTGVTLTPVPLPEGFRDLVDSVDEHSRLPQQQRPKKVRPIPAGQRADGETTRGNRRRKPKPKGQSEHNAHPARQERKDGRPAGIGDGKRRRRFRGGNRAASGGQRG
ncbi:MAG TPA: DEAD/DEAH box helicase [Sphingomonadaceae bacterium]|nr:DEAD/DEAH box helicase [Sphingomonadaceae bacterium]